jgi:outer membrane lipoprotein-sorting protein
LKDANFVRRVELRFIGCLKTLHMKRHCLFYERVASEQRAMTILKNMSQYLAQGERFNVTIRDGYDAVQRSGQKIEYGEVRKVTVSRPDRLRFEIERSDGEKGLVIFDGKERTSTGVDFQVWDKSFAYSNGVFYEEAGQGYKIVDPPVGVLVPSIPEAAAIVTVDGAKYFEFGGMWYRPFYNGNDVVYQTVPNPTG